MEGDIGELSLQDFSSSIPPPSSSSSSAQPPPSFPPTKRATFPLTPLRPSTPSGSPRPLLSPRIPSSPSSTCLAISPPPLTSPRRLSPAGLASSSHSHLSSPTSGSSSLTRSNSNPRPAGRRRHGFSQDLGISDLAQESRRVGDVERAKMRRWAEALVVVNFNLDVGPEVERCVPERRWGIGVGENIAFSSFPDTTLFNEGHISWSFKLNDPLPKSSTSSSTYASSTSSGSLKSIALGEELDPNGGEGGGQQEGRLFGFVLFLQKRDGTIKRGYFQKSLVLLTPLPYPSLFANIVSFLAPKFFAEGPAVLEAACREMASWPSPTPGATLSLPLLGTTFNVQLPSPNQSSQLVRTSLAPSSASSSTISLVPASPSPSRPASSSSSHLSPHSASLLSPHPLQSQVFDPRKNILASLPRTPPLKLLGSILPSLWLIWECLILAEPLLCIAPDPRTCSELVWWLRDFIRPLPPGGDIRPYFHIHDASFPLLVNSHQPPPGTVLGVTNPFFRQACGHWSNVISIGDRAGLAAENGRILRPNSMKQPTSKGGSSATSVGGGKNDHPDGFKSKRKRHVDKDPELLKRLETVVASGGAGDFSANNDLRFHFADLTEKFLVPLNRYFASLIPTDLTPTPINTLPPLKPFSPSGFLASLKAHGHPLTFRSKVSGGGGSQVFYESFLKSRNFGVWLTRRCGEANEECEKRARRGGWVGGS